MNSAILRHPIDILELVTEKTEYGTIQTHYELKYSTRAYVKFNSQQQIISEGEIYYPDTRTFIVRAYVPVVETDRIRWDGNDYDITSINKNIYYNDIEIICNKVNK